MLGWILAILATLLVILIVWIISTQRGLVSLEERCKNAVSQISVQQNSRWDALGALSQLVKNYDEHEYTTMTDIIAVRKPLTRDSNAGEINAQESAFTQALGRVNALAEAYPDIKAQSVYQNAMDGVKQYEDNVRKSRMVYNDTVTMLNRRVRSIPTSLIAGTLGFSVHDYLDVTEEKAEMPSFSK